MPTKIGERPIYKFFIDFDGKYFPIRCMLDLGSTSFVISPETAKAFQIPVVKRTILQKTSDVGGTQIKTEGLYTIPLGLSFGNHRTYDVEDHAFEVLKTSSKYDALIPAWYLKKHRAEGMSSQLYFPHCDASCFGHEKIRPDYEISYDRRVALRPDAINIGSIISRNPEIAKKLPTHYHKWLLLFDPEESEKLPDNKGCDHRIELKLPEEQLRMGPIYQLSLEEEKILMKYLEKMISEGKIRQSSSSVGSPILFVPKPNGKGLRLCVDYRHLNQHTVKDKTPLPIMDELKQRINGANYITKLDFKSGFHLMRMALGHEKYTAFRTKFGLFEYLVMPFGLTNAPATFQREVNRILRPVLGIELVINTKIHIDEDEGMVVVAYIDDILIATKGSLAKHQKQVGKVFDLLQDNKMCLEIDKCVFDAQEVTYLGFIVNGKELKMDPKKAEDIVNWPRPTNQEEVQQLLGLWNFYRRFIPNFAGIVAPITDLLRGDGKNFVFGDAQEAAFLKITVLFTSGATPIMRHFDQNRPAMIETDASDFAIGAILSQKFEDGKIHPVSFLSRKMSDAEFNYDVFDKEMLAIVYALEKWRQFLQGSEFKTTIYSDHQNLSYYTTKVVLNRRQARWALLLKGYDFVIVYRKGSQNQKADILSRCPAYTFREGGTTAISTEPLLGPDQWLEVGAMEIEDEDFQEICIGAMEVGLLLPEQKEKIINDAMLDERYRSICKLVKKGNNSDDNYEIVDDLLCWKGRLYAPEKTRKAIIRSEHDSKIAGHFGRDRTLELVSRNFYWPKMEDDIRKYCNECDNCQRTKAPRHAKHGLLHPLELASKPWTHVSTDFITDLPESGGYKNILVVVDRFTKMAHFIPIVKREATEVARAYLNNVWKYHGIPQDVVSDRDATFTGQYITNLYDYLGIKRSMSTAYHPQTDGQTERMNQVIEAYLRSYCNYEQNDWSEMLAMAEYAYNNSKHSATKISPFYANYRYEPRTNWPTEVQFRNPASELYAHYMNTIHEKLKEKLSEARGNMAKYYDKKRRDIPGFKKGEFVMLNGKNIRSKGRCRKLEDKMYGPFEVLHEGHNKRYCKLKLPTKWKIHPVFNISLLEKYRGTNPEREVVEIEADDSGWKIESIIASGPSDDDGSKHVYLVKWEGFPHEENTWESYDNVVEFTYEVLEEYYKKNPMMEKDSRFGKGKPKEKIKKKKTRKHK